MSINDAWQKVAEFHKKFDHPVSNGPRLLPEDRVVKRSNWMQEEIDEFIRSRTVADQADAMIDLMYFALGTLVEMGVPPAQLFDIVHEANMRKIKNDGKALYREDGKIAKPQNWIDPTNLIEEAISQMVEIE